MKVEIYEKNSIMSKIVNSVVGVICCSDGRHLVTYEEGCPCCDNKKLMTQQVPAGWRVEITRDKKEGK